MSESKKYRLLKDLPNLKKGTIIRWSILTGGYRYFSDTHFYEKHNYEDDMRNTFPAGVVENNPEWFEEVKEPNWFVWTDDAVKILLRKVTSYIDDDHWDRVIDDFKYDYMFGIEIKKIDEVTREIITGERFKPKENR